MGFPGGSNGKEPLCNARYLGLRPGFLSLGWEDPLKEGLATHSSILAWQIPMDRGAWQAAVHGVIKSQTWLSDSAQHSTLRHTSELGAAAAKSLQSCLTLCDPIEGSPPGTPIPGILQARTLEWVAISFSNEWKWKVKVKSFSRVQLVATPWTTAYQAPPSMGFSRQEYWSGVPLPSPVLDAKVDEKQPPPNQSTKIQSLVFKEYMAYLSRPHR